MLLTFRLENWLWDHLTLQSSWQHPALWREASFAMLFGTTFFVKWFRFFLIFLSTNHF